MKPHVLTLLAEKLRQREMRAALTRSKRITKATREAPRPILDALTKLAKETGKPGEDILNEFVTGKASFPALDAALASHRKPSSQELDEMQRKSLDAKARREQAQADLERKVRDMKFTGTKPAPAAVRPAAAAAKPAPAASASPAPETEQEKVWKEYSSITDPIKKRAYRISRWSKLRTPIQPPDHK